MNFRIGWILFLWLLVNTSYGGNYPDWNFRFPLDIETMVSGSFGELRGNHFHSGVDFTTQGKTGFPVYSIEDGYVSRIAVSPTGFGKALYIAHPNGYTSVYAHLESFSSTIEKVVLDFQYSQESFQINEYLQPGELNVKKGELIALSGNSGGSSGPHLHFEIRETSQQKPLNVHRFGLSIMDDKPPHIQSVSIYPLSENATINGKKSVLHLPVVFHSGRFHLKSNPTIEAFGSIGIGVETLDYYPNSWRKCGVYSIRLSNNDDLVFQSKVDGFLFSDTRYINSHLDYRNKMLMGKRIQKSFLDDNNQLDIYTTNKNRGVVNITSFSENNFEYKIADASDNLSFLSFKIVGASPTSTQKVFSATSTVEMISPQNSFQWEQDGYKIHFPANSFYTEVAPNFKVINASGLNSKIQILDNTIPIHSYFELSMPIPSSYTDQKGITVAYIDGRGRTSYVGGKIVDKHLVAKGREGGMYTFAVDTVAPTLRLKSSPANQDYSNRSSIKIHLSDDFSGIAEYKCTIDGKWVMFEYDPKNSELTGFFKYIPLDKGKRHELVVTATDQLSNSATLKSTFVY